MSPHKPLATLGDALRAKGQDWRAEMRANDVDRRAPLPDRGHVEQPGERRPPPVERRRVVAAGTTRPPVALVRPLVTPEPPPQPPPPPVAVVPAPARPAPEPPPPASKVEPVETPKPAGFIGHGADGRALYTARFRRQVGREWLRRKAADDALTLRAFAAEKGVKPSVMSRWTTRAAAERADVVRSAGKSPPGKSPAAPAREGKAAFERKAGGRSPAVVMAELTRKLAELEPLAARVAELKSELRALLEV